MKTHKAIHILAIIAFLLNLLTPLSGQAQSLAITQDAASKGLTSQFNLPTIVGIKIHPENPFLMDFIIDEGTLQLSPEALAAESEKLVKYFLASLTVPDEQAWVNLSPNEKNRIIPDSLGQTTMGKVMLEQDYALKQLASSLTNPDEKLGQEFWNKIRAQAGSREVPMETMNKVWIVPGVAEVYEGKDIALIGQKSLKVMMADEYEAMAKSADAPSSKVQSDATNIASSVFRNTILPSIQKDVNEAKSFAEIRQVYNSVILAAWYKKTLKESVLGHLYTDQNKIVGIEGDDINIKQKVYEKYLEAFKKGAYNLIREEEDSVTGDLIPRKYFSGGFVMAASSALEVHIFLPGRPGDILPPPNKLTMSQFEMLMDAQDSGGPTTSGFSTPPEFIDSGDPAITTNPGELDGLKNMEMPALRFLIQFRNHRGRIDYEKIRRFDTFMTLLHATELMQNEEKVQRGRALLKLLSEDTVFGSVIRNMRNSIYRELLTNKTYESESAEALVERIDEKLYVVLETSYELLPRAFPDWESSLPPVDYSREPPEDPSKQIINNIVDNLLRRILSGDVANPSIPIPRDVREGLGEIVSSIFKDASAQPPIPWIEADTVIDTFNNYEPTIKPILINVDLNKLFITNYYDENDLYYRSLGISVEAISVDGGMITALSVTPELNMAIRAELSAYLKISQPTLFTLQQLGDVSLVESVQRTPPRVAKKTSRKDLERLKTADLEEKFLEILENPIHRDIVTLGQWKIYSIGIQAATEPVFRGNLIEMIDDFEKYGTSGAREDYLPVLAMAQEIMRSLSDLSMRLKQEGARNDLPGNFEKLLTDEMAFTSRLLSPTKDSPTLNTEEETESWVNRVNFLFETKEKADIARQGAASTPLLDNNVGGIDFNKDNLNLQIKRDGNGVVLPVSQQNLDQLKIDGLVPILIGTSPVNIFTLPQLIQKQ